MTDIPELTRKDFGRGLKSSQRRRIMQGKIDSGDDVVALRLFVGLTQKDFALALGISVHTLRNWEQGRRKPEGPALALLRIAACHPKMLRENLASAALATATAGSNRPRRPTVRTGKKASETHQQKEIPGNASGAGAQGGSGS